MSSETLPQHWDVPTLGVPNVSMTLFVDGDTTFTWSQEDDAAIREMVQKKMDEGFVFMIVEPASIFGRMVGKKDKRVRVKNIDQVQPGKPLVIPTGTEKAILSKVTTSSKELNEVLDKKKAAIVGPSDKRGGKTDIVAVKTAKSVDEVVSNHTVAVPKFVGG